LKVKKDIFKGLIIYCLLLIFLLSNSSIANTKILQESDSQNRPGLIAYYSFDGDLTDQTGNWEAGKVTGDRIDNTGGTMMYSKGKFEQAAVFDGSSGIRLPDGLIKSNKYSVLLWLKPEELTMFTTTFFGAKDMDNWVSLVPGGNAAGQTVVWSHSTTGPVEWYDASIGYKINTNEWTHLAFTIDEGRINVYVNGEIKFTGDDFPNIFDTENAVFGLGVNYWDPPYKGLIDELLIYDGMVLTARQIKNYYETGEIPVAPDVSRSRVEELLAQAKAIKNNGIYTEESYQKLQSAIASVEEALANDGEREDWSSEIAALEAAMKALEYAYPIPEFVNVSVHDPSIVKDGDTYYVFGSHIEAAKSTDLMKWTKFTNGYTTPRNALFGDLSENLAGSFAWAGENDSDSKGGFAVWAPQVFWNEDYVNEDGTKGAYMLYYSVSSTYVRSAIGFAVSQNIEGPYKYVDTIVYSGFTRDEAYDYDSDVNKKWTNTNIPSLIKAGILESENPKWFKSDGSYNNLIYPNAIDPNIFYDKSGRLWMTYGSWSGGIFILELDKETGRPIYPGKDGITDDGRLIDRYFGTKIAGGYHKSMEGPYVVYHPDTDYYYLYVSYGWLGADGEYNIRVFRSKNPEGPYVDSRGQNAVLTGNVDHSPIGNKLMGHFLFERKLGDPGTGIGYGYVSPGHNSVYLDTQTGEQYLVFHTRFPQRGEIHEVRVHQLFMNEDGWPVVAPYRYTGETLEPIDKKDIPGEYQFINHEKDISKILKKAVTISLNDDGTISGPVSGTWELIDDYYANVTIDGKTYKGVFLRQWTELTETKVITFTALSDEGKSIWGIKTIQRTDEEIGEIIKNELTLGDTSAVISNLTLPTEGIGGATISWTSSNPDVITEDGIVNRPEVGSDDAIVTLTATITKGNYTATKTFTVVVLAKTQPRLVAHYSFDSDLSDKTGNNKESTITGDRINNTGGSITFKDGVVGKAAYFDGKSGILLPNGLISSYVYTVSFWVKPEQLTYFTTTFFGATSERSWVSFVLQGPIEGQSAVWSGEDWYDGVIGMTMPVNEWSHVAFTVDNGKLDVYINGEKKFSGTGFPNVFTTRNAVFGLGVNYWDPPFKGLIDELLIYDGIAISEETIKTYYETGKIPQVVELDEAGKPEKPEPIEPTEPTEPSQEVSQGRVVVENNTIILKVDENKVAKDIKDTSKKEIQFDLTNIGTTPQKALEIPVTVFNLIVEYNKNVVVKLDEVALQFDAKTLTVSQETIDLINKAGTIKLNIHNKGKITASTFEPVTDAYDITIKAGDKDIKIGSPVKMTFNIEGAKDIRKVGAYYLNETTNRWEYIGGKIDRETNTITFEAKHFSTYAAFQYNKQFKDVSKDNWAYDVINVLASRHIIKGIDENTFLPNKKITRAEFAALMTRALGIEEKPYKGQFNDVKEGAWYANAVEAAYKAGIILGDGKNMRPNDPITREEMAAVIMRVYGKLVEYREDNIGNTTFSDNNKISEWAKNAVANAVKLGIVKGYEDNTFRPKENATRAEAAAMLYRALEKTGNI